LATFESEWKGNRGGFIYREVTFGQKRVTIGFCNSQKFEKPPKTCHVWAKRDTIHHFQKKFLPRNRVTFGLTCHDLAMTKGHQF